jgi:hypothetical protein
MEISSHPSVDELRSFTREGRDPRLHDMWARRALDGGGHTSELREGTALRDLPPGAQLICEKCGHVMGFEIEKLQRNQS